MLDILAITKGVVNPSQTAKLYYLHATMSLARGDTIRATAAFAMALAKYPGYEDADRELDKLETSLKAKIHADYPFAVHDEDVNFRDDAWKEVYTPWDETAIAFAAIRRKFGILRHRKASDPLHPFGELCVLSPTDLSRDFRLEPLLVSTPIIHSLRNEPE